MKCPLAIACHGGSLNYLPSRAASRSVFLIDEARIKSDFLRGAQKNPEEVLAFFCLGLPFVLHIP